jgi:hypothetical protein
MLYYITIYLNLFYYIILYYIIEYNIILYYITVYYIIHPTHSPYRSLGKRVPGLPAKRINQVMQVGRKVKGNDVFFNGIYRGL